MCGLFAWWPKNPSIEDKSRAQSALDALRERGPDSEALWVDPKGSALIGHRRLKITGERGEQPLWNKERTLVAIVNGEIYDVPSRRAELEVAGYEFQTDSDSELVLAVYACHGVAGLPLLEGEFAFVLWDTERDIVWAARDRGGVKPLRFILDARGLAFASEAKAFFAAGWPARWDRLSLAQALSVQYQGPKRTLFEGVSQIAPGEAALFSRQRGEWSVLRWTWWEWFNASPESLARPSLEQAAATLGQCIRRAVDRRLDTHWPVAVHLSGGLDSSAILTAASLKRKEGLHAFSVGFEPPDAGSAVAHDECALAEKTAKQLGVPWTRVDANRPALLAHWKDAVHRAEGIGINGHLVAKWLLAREIHNQGYRVSLSGEGADEALLGYAFLSAEHAPGDRSMQARLRAENPVALGSMLPEGVAIDLSTVEEAWGVVPVWLTAKATLGARLQGLMRKEWKEQICPSALREWAQETRPALAEKLPVHAAASSWARLALGGYILPALADAPEAAWHIQGRVPFLDSDLLSEVYGWEPEATGWPELPKAPLRQWLREQGLMDVANRPKHPFEAPPLWGSSLVRAEIMERFTHPGAWDQTPFDAGKVSALLDHLDQATATEHQVWEPVIATLLSVHHMKEVFGLVLGESP